MSPSLGAALAACVIALGSAGCGDFLSESSVATDPNQPSTATRDQLFVAVQAAQFGQQEGILAINACAWMQQCTGTSNFLESIEQYNTTNENLHDPAWATAYEGGGLVDIRSVERSTTESGDLPYLGIAQIWEALDMGTTASIWGNIPYRQAANTSEFPNPVLDPQLQVYDDLQALLDQAIANLDGAGAGPEVLDLVYGGDVAKWKEAAHTLKARFYMHTAEVRGTGAYQNAITQATSGIGDPANDLRSVHGSSNQVANLWSQFLLNSGFGGYLVAGRFLAELMVARNDPRLPEYFGPASPGPGFGGQDPDGGQSDVGVSPLEGTRATPDFRQPIVTWVENQLILAEANLAVNGAAAAQPFLDAVRASIGLASVPATLNSIMEEKYVALFQNIEVWNDYKRTCYPPITAFSTVLYSDKIPGRLFYSTVEENANRNLPDESAQLAEGGLGFRNPNDPNPCP